MTKDLLPLLTEYFPEFSQDQLKVFQIAARVWTEENEKVNVISRKDMEYLAERHILHSLALFRLLNFPSGSTILDIGTGGGFPGLPLAIARPDCSFVLIDSIAKKIRVVEAVVEATCIQNVQVFTGRAEDYPEKGEYIVSRAVSRMDPFIRQVKHLIRPEKKRNPATGIYYLKGGNPDEELGQELKECGRTYELYALREIFHTDFFDTKFLVHIPILR